LGKCSTWPPASAAVGDVRQLLHVTLTTPPPSETPPPCSNVTLWYTLGNVTNEATNVPQTPAQKQQAYRDRLKQRALGNLPAAPIIANIPPERRWKALQDQARTALQTMLDEMTTYHQDRSDTWQDSERGEAFQERLDTLTEIVENLDDLAT
jgi:hypothetical protein